MGYRSQVSSPRSDILRQTWPAGFPIPRRHGRLRVRRPFLSSLTKLPEKSACRPHRIDQCCDTRVGVVFRLAGTDQTGLGLEDHAI